MKNKVYPLHLFLWLLKTREPMTAKLYLPLGTFINIHIKADKLHTNIIKRKNKVVTKKKVRKSNSTYNVTRLYYKSKKEASEQIIIITFIITTLCKFRYWSVI